MPRMRSWSFHFIIFSTIYQIWLATPPSLIYPPPFFFFWHSQPWICPATAGIVPTQSISICRGPIKLLWKCLSVLPVNQCILSPDSFCREQEGCYSKRFSKLPGLIVGSWERCPTETIAFFLPSLSPFSTTLRCDQDADPNALARVSAGLLPCTQVNRLLWVFPGLQRSKQLEKDYHKLMFTL